jgi:AcrR family transcriptional regulator
MIRRPNPSASTAARQRIFKAAVQVFANRGYAAASVQEIVRRARVTKPTLYYYFESKAVLYRHLVHHAQDEWQKLITQAAGRACRLEDRLTRILCALFEFSRTHRELTRLCYASAFAAPGEVPDQRSLHARGIRNFELIIQIVKAARQRRELDSRFDTLSISSALFGQIMVNTIFPLFDSPYPLTPATARRLVKLFLRGASPSRR